LSRGQCALHARIAHGHEPDQRNHEQARVELVAAVVLHEGAELLIEALRAYFRMDVVADATPVLQRTVATHLLNGLDGAVESHPGHDFGMREMTPRSAHFPDAFV